MSLKFNPKTGEWEGVTGGVDLQDLDNRKQRLQERKATRTLEQKKEAYENEIKSNRYYDYARKFTYYLAEQMELPLTNVSFNNSHSFHRNKSIQYSYQQIDDMSENGFYEYVSIAWVWGRGRRTYNKIQFDNMKGKKAVWALCLHEFAHRMQTEKGGRSYRSVHNQCFVECLRELQILFPYVECDF